MPSGREKRRRQGQELGQRGARPRAVISGAGGSRHASMRTACTLDRGAGDARGLAQEGRLALVGLDQIEAARRWQAPASAREAGAGAEIDGPVASGGSISDSELERIGDMALPQHRAHRPAKRD